jgi:prevent-host-death family protein
MRIVKVHEAKTHLSRLLERVEKGEEIVIARGNVPVARLVRVAAVPRRPGRLKGRIRVGRGFDAPLPAELLSAFRGERD